MKTCTSKALKTHLPCFPWTGWQIDHTSIFTCDKLSYKLQHVSFKVSQVHITMQIICKVHFISNNPSPKFSFNPFESLSNPIIYLARLNSVGSLESYNEAHIKKFHMHSSITKFMHFIWSFEKQNLSHTKTN